jgi:hypothetical protein
MFRIVVSFLAIMALATVIALLLVYALDLLQAHGCGGDDIACSPPAATREL